MGGQALSGNFYFAYERILPPPPAREETFEFVRKYLEHPASPVFRQLRTPMPGDVSLSDTKWAIDNQAPAKLPPLP